MNETYPEDLVRHVAASTGLSEATATRVVADVKAYFSETVEAYARRGFLPSVKLGRHRRFVRSEVERAILLLQSELPRGGRHLGINGLSRPDFGQR